MDSKKGLTERPKHPAASAGRLSALTFSWIIPLFILGNERTLESDDLYETLREHSSDYLGEKFEKTWNEEKKKQKEKGKENKPSLTRVIFRVLGWDLFTYGALVFFVEIFLKIAQPILLGSFINYFTPGSDVSFETAVVIALAFFFCTAVSVVSMHPFMNGVLHIGMKVRVACCSMVYRKALRLRKTALNNMTVGKVVNLMSNDVSRFDNAFFFAHYLWVAPLQSLIVTYFLWELIGPASLIGLVSILMFIPLQAWLGKMSSGLRLKTAVRTDHRIRLMNEVITGIQIIKMYTWESSFAQLVSEARKKEVNVIRQSSYIKSVLLSFITFHTRASIFVSILAYLLFGNTDLTAYKVYMVISFFNTVRETITIFFPQAIGQVAEGRASVKRLEEFLFYEELPNPGGDCDQNGVASSNTAKEIIVKTPGVFVKNATAKWTDDGDNSLSDISFEATPGKLVVIIGTVGSGKSSLLNLLLKELPLSKGTVNICGSVSYACQDSWLFGGTVRQNIIFCETYDPVRYKSVVQVCGLVRDFEQLPYGDKTLVGERGTSLSGGQRARINLARAVYKKSDIYLLDDPLSAVDAHVGRHIFEDCITGYLKKKTVILVTHQLQYLTNVEHIIFLENGSIKAQGSFRELMESGESFTSLLQSSKEEKEEEVPNEGDIVSLVSSRKSSLHSIVSSSNESCVEEPVEVAEDAASGSVDVKTYKAYFFGGAGWLLVTVSLGLALLSQTLCSFGDYWINYWVNLEEHNFNSTVVKDPIIKISLPLNRELCVYILAAINVGTILFSCIRGYVFFYSCLEASTKLHNNMFVSITHATMKFFNTNPSGRILNRFSGDTGKIDEILPSCMMDCLLIALNLVFVVIIVSIINFWLLIPTFVAAFVFYLMRNFYLRTSRSIKRLEGTTRSPVFSHLSSSIQGLSTIRAFNAQKVVMNEFDNHQNLHSTAWFLLVTSSRAFGYWLDVVCLVYIALVTFSFLLTDQGNFGGNVGLAIIQSITITGMFQWGMRQSAEFENLMTAVERVMEYTDLESEPALESPKDKKPPSTWPAHGKIVFDKVFLKYSSSDEWVLKNVSFTILPQQKVGIVGRTGAGKSSLISALFRLFEVQGSVIIDDVNVGNIGIHELRSKISIIPQEPVLFSGTLRYNLDPFGKHQDEVLWKALEQVELKALVSDLPGGLTTPITEGGSNMSVGQRQLLCLARAIIRNNKILIMDEATANVDPQTDALIQRTIRERFSNCTVLTIAHRLHTIIDSDKVLVMDAGSMVEFDHSYVLLKKVGGYFFNMVEQTGKATVEALLANAEKSYNDLIGNTAISRSS